MSYQKYANLISKEFIRNHEESERILKFFFEKISQDIARGERVYFRGFGSFKKANRPPRKYRNMITGKIETRPTVKDVDFSPCKKLLGRI